MAAHLTAVAYGQVGKLAFVHVSDCGRGIFARQRLMPGDDICEYGGPRLPLEHLQYR